MRAITGAVVLTWRRSMGWDVPETARRLRVAAGAAPLPAHDSLVHMIRRWEREDSGVSERYELTKKIHASCSAAADLCGDMLG